MARILMLCSCIFLATAAPTACKSADDGASAQEISESPEAIVEQHDKVSIAWTVNGDGETRAVVLEDGKPAKQKYEGKLSWDDKTIELKPNEKTGVLEADGPKLDADITEIAYAVIGAEGAKLRGNLHLPRGGTKALAESAKESASVDVQGKVGPHGGKIQVVGKDRVELVANPDNGELRVYVLDADLQPVAVGDRKITVAVVSDKPQVVVLVPEPKGQYASAKLASTAEPVKVTVSITSEDTTHVVLVDHRPRAVVVVGSSAPRVKIMVKGTFWAPTVVVVDDDRPHHTKIHIKNKRGKGKGNGGSQVKVHVH